MLEWCSNGVAANHSSACGKWADSELVSTYGALQMPLTLVAVVSLIDSSVIADRTAFDVWYSQRSLAIPYMYVGFGTNGHYYANWKQIKYVT